MILLHLLFWQNPGRNLFLPGWFKPLTAETRQPLTSQRLCASPPGVYCAALCDSYQYVLVDRLSTLIPDTARRQVALELPMRDFEMAYRLDCRNLCADFCEDIEFRFSLGLGSLLRRFLGKTGMQRFARGYSQVCTLPAAFPTVSMSWCKN